MLRLLTYLHRDCTNIRGLLKEVPLYRDGMGKTSLLKDISTEMMFLLTYLVTLQIKLPS
jgi:hypothetical protein